jgi:hypothetical protein
MGNSSEDNGRCPLNELRKVYKLVPIQFTELSVDDMFCFDDGPVGPENMSNVYKVVEAPKKVDGFDTAVVVQVNK